MFLEEQYSRKVEPAELSRANFRLPRPSALPCYRIRRSRGALGHWAGEADEPQANHIRPDMVRTSGENCPP